MSHEQEHQRASSNARTPNQSDTVAPGKSSRSALLRKPKHPVASGLVQQKARDSSDSGAEKSADLDGRDSSRARAPSGTRVGEPPSTQQWRDAAGALAAAADIMSNQRSRGIGGIHSSYVSVLWKLYAAVSGTKDGLLLSAAKRNAMFQEARRELAPAIELYATTDEGKSWLEDYFYPEFNANISSFAFAEAKERVHHAVLVDPAHVIEIPPDDEPRERGRLLHMEIDKLVPVMRGFNEQMVRMNEHAIAHEAKALFEHGEGHVGNTGSLAELANLLMLVEGWLTLNDEEFKKHLDEIRGVCEGISTYAELVKAVTELTGGALGLTATVAAGIARGTGNAVYANVASGIARKVGLVFADVVSGIEILHGAFVLFDPYTTRQEKVDGAVDVATGGAWFLGRSIGGAAMGFAASSSVILGYVELKWAVTTYWESSVGINSMLMGQAYETLARHGDAIARSADDLAKAQLLARQEKEPTMQASLHQVETALASALAASVDSLIVDCGPADQEAGVANKPGAFPILRELFEPLRARRGARNPQAAIAAGVLALEKVTWARTHAPDIVVESTRNRDLHAVEQDAVERERKSEAGHD